MWEKKFFVLISVVLLAMFLLTTPAFAEGEVPDGTETPIEEITQTSDEPALLEEMSVPEAEGELSQSAGEETPETPAAEPCLEETVPEENVLTEDLPVEDFTGEEQAPEATDSATDVQLVNASGETVDLASHDSAGMLTAPDPYFTVGTTTYSFTSSDCDPGPLITPCPNPIQAALQYMSDNNVLPTNRKLYVEGGTYLGFTVDGSSSTQMQQLNGIIGEDGSQNTIVDGDIYIVLNAGGFTLQGFTINSATGYSISFDNNAGTLQLIDLAVTNSGDSHGLIVSNHTGSVEMDRVDVSGNMYHGASIDNSTANFPVKITNSNFSGNGGGATESQIGLNINTLNKATLNGVVVAANNGDGIDLSYGSATLKNVYIFGNQDSASDWGWGIYGEAVGNGTLSMTNVYANNNDGGFTINGGTLIGKYIEANGNGDDCGLEFYNSDGNIRIEYGSFNNNYVDGLHIDTAGSTYLSSIHANFNVTGNGAFIYSEGPVTITSPRSCGTNCTNGFYGNALDGLNISSLGSVKVNNFDSGNNLGNGLIIDNTAGLASVSVKVTIKNWRNGVFNNTGLGISINSSGMVNLYNTEIWENLGAGGLSISSAGSIKLEKVIVRGNLGWGAILDNTSSPRSQGVTLNLAVFDNNGSDGISIYSNGAVTARGFSANGNSGYGALVSNSFGARGVTIKKGSSKYGWEYYEGQNYFSDNTGGSGLEIITLGSIKINNTYFGGNTGFGLNFSNDSSLGAVQIKYASNWNHESWSYSGNTFTGIYVRTKGPILLQYIDSGENGGLGADLDNCLVSSFGVCQGFGSISVKASSNWVNTFNNNLGMGLLALSNGSIKVYNIQCSGNLSHGALLRNQYDGSYGSVTVTTVGKNGWNSFDQNGNNGLRIGSYGAISIKNLSGWNNGNDGAELDNYGGPLIKPISIYRSNFDENSVYGIFAESKGNITYKFGGAGSNGYKGVSLYSENGNVTVQGSKKNWMYVNNNGLSGSSFGLDIDCNGHINLAFINVYDNANIGIYAENNYDLLNPKNVLLTDVHIGGNLGDGLNVETYGNITIKGITSEFNFNNGANLTNEDSMGNITITNTRNTPRNAFYENGNAGLRIKSSGNVSITNAEASGNDTIGILVANWMGTGYVKVTTNNGRYWLNDNGLNGLHINTRGNVTITNRYGLEANWNGDEGIYIYNLDLDLPYVKLTRVTANDNIYSSGIHIATYGNIIASHVNANNNGNEPGYYGYGIYMSSDAGYVSLSGRNFFTGNNYEGLYVETINGNILLNGVYAANNGLDGSGFDGIYAVTDYGNITLKNSTLRENLNGAGANLRANMSDSTTTFTIYNVNAFGNGWFSGTNWNDGIYIHAADYSNVTIKNSYLQSNAECGLEIYHTDPATFMNTALPPNLYFINTKYFGNGGPNIYINGVIYYP